MQRRKGAKKGKNIETMGSMIKSVSIGVHLWLIYLA